MLPIMLGFNEATYKTTVSALHTGAIERIEAKTLPGAYTLMIMQ